MTKYKLCFGFIFFLYGRCRAVRVVYLSVPNWDSPWRHTQLFPDCRITPVKSGLNTVRLHWSKTGICSVLTLGASLGLIIFTVLIRKSEKQWKVLRDCLKNLPTGIPSGHQTFPRGCAPRESLMTLGNSLGQIFPDNPYGLSTVCTRLVYHVTHSFLQT